MTARPTPAQLTGERVLLRRWRDDDLAPFAALNADPAVMRWFPAPLSRARSDGFVTDRAETSFADGLGLWAVERRDTGEFIGFTGTVWQRFAAPFTPAVEVGWRFAAQHWGHGFAPEAATLALDDVFARQDLPEIVSMTVPGNVNSRRVMVKLGMTYDSADDFDHANLPTDSPLRPHVLYRLAAADWRARR